MLVALLEALLLCLMGLMVAYLVRHYIFTLTVLRNLGKQKKAAEGLDCVYQPTVSILVAACDEERVLGRLLQRLTTLSYPADKTQIVIVDDGSRDKTGAISDQFAASYSFIEVVHRTAVEGRKGKAAALNAALKRVKGEIILCFDADYYPQRDVVTQLVKDFADPKVGAVQGRVTVLNEPKNVVTRLVALERIGGYRIDQQARSSLGLITQFGGTVGGFRRSLLESLGGWDELILAEDTDLTLRVYLAGYKVSYVNQAESYEEAVENWRAYWKQRYRWSRGHMDCAFKHALGVLRSKHLRLIEKIDALLLLNVYFMPILVLLSWIIYVALFFLGSSRWIRIAWFAAPISIYSFVGNFAPFFEVGVGAYLDGRKRAHWLISLLIFTFVYNIFICTKAFVDLSTSKILRRNNARWQRTFHSGNGNSYIVN